MRFWLGVHRPNWARTVNVPLFLSHRRLKDYRTLPVPVGEWCLDSGAFSELSSLGRWDTTVSEYVEAVHRYQEEMGGLVWAAPMDWMCEPFITDKTGLSVREHQERTVANYLELKGQGPFIPVLQGWEADEYHACADLYESAGVNLASEPVIGIGSVCRRQGARAAEDIIVSLVQRGYRLHGFGVKADGLRRFGYLLESADSMAWSYAGRRKGSCPGKSNCQNHLHYALEWRKRLLASMDYQQTHLGVA